ncbi:hypothetical protein ABZX77_40760 [Streptomyces sp. NPDC004237]|uniref:hypothetical protein n=1 Tax=Streptomyces sp. NPDC004237 TaxID=3154455 RepID=UPI0033A747B0
MIIFYEPADGIHERFEVGKGRLRASEIQIIERTADARWDDIKGQIREGDLGAMRVVVWALKKRSQPALRFAEFDPYEGELRSRFDEREVRGFAEAFVEKFSDDPDQLAEAFDELRESAADAEVADKVIAEVTAPKDPAPAPEPPGELAEMPSEASPTDG